VFLFVTIAYAGVWLALGMLFSIAFRTAATAALGALGLWLFLVLIWPIFADGLATIIAPPDPRFASIGLPSPDTYEWRQILSRLSPVFLYAEVMQLVLNPAVRGLGLVGGLFLPQGAVPNAPMPFAESVMVVWPQIVGLIAATIVLFVIGYIVFQRQEVRA
jgi:ABC-2 type transport system permease protein